MSSGRHTRSWVDTDGGTPVTGEKTVTDGLHVKLTEIIPADASDLAIGLGIDFSALKSLFVVADQDLIIETNNSVSASADDSWDLKANQPLDWQDGDVHDKPLTADVTVIYVTNGSTETTLELRALVDATP